MAWRMAISGHTYEADESRRSYVEEVPEVRFDFRDETIGFARTREDAERTLACVWEERLMEGM